MTRMTAPHTINVTKHPPERRPVYIWECTCGQLALQIYPSRTLAELDAHQHLHTTHRLNPPPTPQHVISTAPDGVGGWDWTCTCGAHSDSATSHRQDRRAKQAGTLHRQNALLRFYRTQVMSERSTYERLQKQTEEEQLRMSRLSPEGRERLIQRNLESIL